MSSVCFFNRRLAKGGVLKPAEPQGFANAGSALLKPGLLLFWTILCYLP
jgi:hypothetical protein